MRSYKVWRRSEKNTSKRPMPKVGMRRYANLADVRANEALPPFKSVTRMPKSRLPSVACQSEASRIAVYSHGAMTAATTHRTITMSRCGSGIALHREFGSVDPSLAASLVTRNRIGTKTRASPRMKRIGVSMHHAANRRAGLANAAEALLDVASAALIQVSLRIFLHPREDVLDLVDVMAVMPVDSVEFVGDAH